MKHPMLVGPSYWPPYPAGEKEGGEPVEPFPFRPGLILQFWKRHPPGKWRNVDPPKKGPGPKRKCLICQQLQLLFQGTFVKGVFLNEFAQTFFFAFGVSTWHIWFDESESSTLGWFISTERITIGGEISPLPRNDSWDNQFNSDEGFRCEVIYESYAVWFLGDVFIIY